MALHRKFVVVDTRGLVPLHAERGDPPCAIDRVRIQNERDLEDGLNWPLIHWAKACTAGDVFTVDGLVYVCAVMWTEDGP